MPYWKDNAYSVLEALNDRFFCYALILHFAWKRVEKTTIDAFIDTQQQQSTTYDQLRHRDDQQQTSDE